MEHFRKIFLVKQQPSNTSDQQIRLRIDSWWCPSRTPDGVTVTYGGLSIRKQQLRQFLNVILEILALNIQRLVSYSESRIKLTKQKLFSADCFCSFLPKFQIFWREIVRSPPLMALPSLCLDIAHNYFDCKAHLKNGCKSHNIYYQN